MFLAIEARSKERAMMPLSLYKSRNFSAVNVLTLLLYFALGRALYYLPFGLIRLGNYAATQAGAALLPFALVMGFGSSFAGMLSDRFGPRPSLTFGPSSRPAVWRCWPLPISGNPTGLECFRRFAY
jgi:MFS family permease